MQSKTFCLLFLILAVAQAVPKYKNTFKSVKRDTVNSRIIGGNQATHHQFPYQVGIFSEFNAVFYGGSLISDRAVLTSAVCTDGRRNFDIHLGAQSINNYEEVDRVIMASSTAVQHANYDSNNLDNNIAIIFLPQSAIGTGIAPIRLPSFSQAGLTFIGTTGRFTGWGHISDVSVNINPELKYVDLTVIDNTACELYYGNLINPSTMCTDPKGGTVGICTGDLGGPLVYNETDGIATQIGIAGFFDAFGCEYGAPSAFTRVTSFLSWIEFNGNVTIRP